MRIFHLSLTNFRLYTRLELSLPTGPILLHGSNAQGKTSVLEAIYYLATSRSPWTVSDKQLLNWRAKDDVMPFVKITAEIARRGCGWTGLALAGSEDTEPENQADDEGNSFLHGFSF